MREIRKPLIVLVVLLALCALVYYVSPRAAAPVVDDAVLSAAPKGEASAPSPEVLAYLEHSSGFQYLVSYNGRSFAPAVLTIKKGETVRFINNSSKNMWVAATGSSGEVYPGSGKDCGQSAFDMCKTLKHGEFWEFTFTEKGSWSYRNNADSTNTGVIIVL
ncbi:hypothetical protein K8R04_03110 [Candidatus Uhrbacteria bacterium]|nr:hypothetical protein [Candidatus Uhrbacteria bacterium]